MVLEWVKGVMFTASAGISAVLATLMWVGKLITMYTLGWFLLGTFIALVRRDNGITITQAFVFGVFTAIFHILICAVRTGVCG